MRALYALLGSLALLVAALLGPQLIASSGEKPVARTYPYFPPAPRDRTPQDMAAQNSGCIGCHTASDAPTMHVSPAVALSCVDCHGGTPVRDAIDPAWPHDDPRYVSIRDKAHVLPKYPASWHWPSSANPERGYTLLNKEAPEYIRFVNPSDYRVARESCGACHMEVIEAAERSIMASGAMLWGGAAYNNGIVPFKNYILGEAYTKTGEPAKIMSPGSPHGTVTDAQKKRGALSVLYPLPAWTVIPPGDVFRVFERGGRTINSNFAEIGLPNSTGSIQRLDEPGRPDLKQSNRGPATGLRVAIPALNIHKTRLNDPFMWFMGTNDQPGDYRNSGCAGCHVVYANDREPRHSLSYASFGRDGQTATVDPTISGKLQKAHDDGHGKTKSHGAVKAYGAHGSAAKEKGHPIQHAFTRAIPTAQCMNCHMHQPNIFLNSYLGYTMWDYESDAPFLWPGPENKFPRPDGISDADYAKKFKSQHYPTAAETFKILDRNPEAAATRGLWGDLEILRNVYDLNPLLKDTQFADYHGHGWNFRAILKRDREGNLLDADGAKVAADDPEKWRKAGEDKFVEPGANPGKTVHMMDIHAEKGLQCADCHFAQDSTATA